jgi:hypothetical protein
LVSCSEFMEWTLLLKCRHDTVKMGLWTVE